MKIFQQFSIKQIILFSTLIGGLFITCQRISTVEKNYQQPELAILVAQGEPTNALRKLLEKFNFAASTLQEIVKATQAGWLRTAGKERWESEDPYANRKDELMPLFEEAGVIDEVKPREKEYDYVLVLGATHSRTQKRLDYVKKLWDEGHRFKEIILLGSERKLDPKEEPASAFGQGPIPQTEFEMMKWVYNHMQLTEEMKKIKTSILNTPNTIDSTGKEKRATTGDTIKQWLATNPKPGSCLIISSQPHVGYQAAVVKTYLPESFKVVPVGDALSKNARICEILDALARWIYQENEFLKRKSQN